MDTVTNEQVATALAAIVREAVAQQKAVHVPDLGTFAVQYRPSELESVDDGPDVIHPPRDEIVFEPAS